MKGCQTIEESLESLVAASEEYTKNHEGEKAFYPTMWHHQMTRYLKLAKRKARFSYNPTKFLGCIEWEVEEFY